MAMRHVIGLLVGCAALGLAAPALADVKDGVDAWSRGDYAAAVQQWQGPADAGDPDAMFNLGQAYRLGLGVTADATRAEYYYAKSAEAGHVRAADTYGLILFQTGRTGQALPYVEAAARRGDPRSQYLLGISYFNGEIVSKDWVKAYALLTLANSQGLPQAASAIQQMDQYIPMAQRQQAAGLAVQMQQDADATRTSELAAFDLESAGNGAPPPPAAGGKGGAKGGGKAAVPPKAAPAPTPPVSGRVPQPVTPVQVPPSRVAYNDATLAEAQDAVRQAMLATGTEDPGDAGADFTRSGAAPVRTAVAQPPAQAPVQAPAPPPVRTSAPKPAAPAPVAAAASGPWKLQLGAFGVRGNAEKLWVQLSQRPELQGRTRLLEPAGKLTKLLAGGFASQAEANAACGRLKAAGQVCVVTR